MKLRAQRLIEVQLSTPTLISMTRWFGSLTIILHPQIKRFVASAIWLGSGFRRTLIYVAGGNRTTEDYLRAAIEKVPMDQKEEYLRRISEEMISDEKTDAGGRQIWFPSDSTECEWV